MTDAVLTTAELRKSFGGVVATDGVSIDLEHAELHAVIGPNGAGKTTLVAQLSGEMAPDSGTIRFGGHDVTALTAPARSILGLARSFQVTSIFRGMTALENVALAAQAHDGHSFRFWRAAAEDERLTAPARGILARVGLAGREQVRASALSHGEQRQLELAMALATKPRALLLDEPMAGMGREESRRMVELLRALKPDYAILLVEHDMDAVFALADRISVLVYGRIIASGPPAEIRADAKVREAYLGESEIHARG
jgi:branched-chain amino acid transport system ATP-binding protein